MTRTIAWEAGHRIETSNRRAKRIGKKCAVCGVELNNWIKKYCGPCSANRHDYTVEENRKKAKQE